jgi:hypothetical protein
MYFQDSNRKLCLKKKEPPMNPIRLFKKKETEGGERRSQLGDQWKVPLLGGP